MSNRKSPFSSKGRGGKRGVVRLKAAKFGNEHARILNEKRDINGVYEDRMVYVKSQAIIPRKPRGRPKKSVLENNSVTPVLKSSTSDVIFLPPVKNGHKAFSITHTQHNKDPTLFSHIPLRQNAQSKTVLGKNSHGHTALGLSMLNSCNFRSVSGTNLYNRTIIGAKPQKIAGSNNMQYQTIFRSNPFSHIAFGSNYHPQSLLRTCLLEPGFPSQAATPIMEVTPEAISKPVSTNQREVVVETQPNAQHCGQWSSMDDVNI